MLNDVAQAMLHVGRRFALAKAVRLQSGSCRTEYEAEEMIFLMGAEAAVMLLRL